MYGFTLILTLVVVGGVIAYIGDRLGMNVGRKKLTLFGLRPKHTSILVTIVTGVLIAGASIGVLTIASQDVRTALFRMKQIQADLKELQNHFDEMRWQRDIALQELVQAEEEVKLQKSSLIANEKTIQEMTDYIDVLRQQADQLEQEVAELEESVQMMRENYALVSTAFWQIRSTDIAFSASEVILTTVLETGQGRAEVRAQLEEFMLEVDEVAYRRSARASEPGKYRAIFVHAGVLDFAVEDALLTKGNVIVRAVSESNTIPGVPVVVYLESFPDAMIFSQGTVLASREWSPDSGVEIDRVILQILNQANNRALEAGVALSREWGAAVLLPGDEFLNALYEAANINEPVNIKLVVANDTWRSKTPVELYLDLEPVSP